MIDDVTEQLFTAMLSSENDDCEAHDAKVAKVTVDNAKNILSMIRSVPRTHGTGTTKMCMVTTAS